MATLAPFAGRKGVNRAKAYVGKYAYSGMCQAFSVTMFGTGGVGDWDGDGDADAVDGWKKAKARGKVRTADQIRDFSKIPYGVILYWSGGSRGYGHAAVSIGGGNMVTTDAGWGGLIGVRRIKGWWAGSHKFLGYAYQDGNGYVLRRIHAFEKAKPSKPRPKFSTYVVTASLVNVRTGPSTKAPIVKRLKRGRRFRAYAVPGSDWLHTKRGHRIHKSYARKA